MKPEQKIKIEKECVYCMICLFYSKLFAIIFLTDSTDYVEVAIFVSLLDTIT